MKYYIIKPKSHDINQSLINGIKERDGYAAIVKHLIESDIVVLQKGWTRSKTAVKEMDVARILGKVVREGYNYTDKYKAHLN